MTLDKAVQLHRNYNVDLNYFAADDSYDDTDMLLQVFINSPKEVRTRMMIRMAEYFIQGLTNNDAVGNARHFFCLFRCGNTEADDAGDVGILSYYLYN